MDYYCINRRLTLFILSSIGAIIKIIYAKELPTIVKDIPIIIFDEVPVLIPFFCKYGWTEAY